MPNTAQAKLLYGFAAAGGTAGALTGPALTALFVTLVGAKGMLLVSAAFLGLAIVAILRLRAWAQRAGATGSGQVEQPPRPAKFGKIVFIPFSAMMLAMKTTIDAAGRIVVPKSLRLALGLKPGQAFEIRFGDGRLEIEIAATPMQLVKRGKGMVAVPDQDLPTLTADLVRDALERIRR